MLFLLSCEKSNSPDEPATRAGLDAANMDTSVSPSEDFYRYVNGGWLDRTEIPSDKSSWGSFNELQENNRKILKAVAEESAGLEKGSDAWKAGLFYRVAMDSANAKAGRPALENLLNIASTIEDKASLQAAMAQLTPYFITGFFGGYVGQDAQNNDINTLYISQRGLSLPDRDYYLKDDEKSKEIRAAYQAHLAQMFELAGDEKADAEAAAERVLSLETAMAEIFMPRTELRNPLKTYNKMAVSDLQERADVLDWKALLESLGFEGADTVIVRTRPYLEKLPAVMEKEGPAAWRDYMRYRSINSMAPYLDEAFADADFDFYSKTLDGVEDKEPRWKEALQVTDRMMGEALGQLYVQRAFPPEAKRDMLNLVGYVKKAMASRIDKLAWMSEETKKEAHKKLEAIGLKVGYPDEWRDYSALEVGEESYAQNVLNARKFGYDYNVNKFGKAPDPNEWGMTPPTVNAYYSGLRNEIVFPAGILQPPFYSFDMDPAVNFGGIAAVIGHEITHGFDDSGRRYNWEGKLKDWWTEDDDERFRARADKLVEQASAYTILDSLNVNGRLTLGENIADLGGLLIAHEAFKLYQQDHEVSQDIGGFSPDQRFFMAWAQGWRRKLRDERARQLLLTDSHAPGEYRGKMPMTNIPAFWEAFGIPEGAPMRASDETRVEIW